MKRSAGNYEFTISRAIDAPPQAVWRMWTQAGELKKWFGPKGCGIPFCSVDAKPGGAALFNIVVNGFSMWGKWSYTELKEPQRLVAIVTFTDEKGEKNLPHPGIPDWPREVLSEVTFIAKEGKTEVSVRWTAKDASATSEKTFREGAPLMREGWGSTFDQLEEHARSAQAA